MAVPVALEGQSLPEFFLFRFQRRKKNTPQTDLQQHPDKNHIGAIFFS